MTDPWMFWNSLGPAGPIVALAIAVLLFVLWVLWMCLPFAVFGTKAAIRDVHRELEATNRRLELILAELRQPGVAARPPAVTGPPSIAEPRLPHG